MVRTKYPRSHVPIQKTFFALLLILILATNNLLPVSARSNILVGNKSGYAARNASTPTFEVRMNEDRVEANEWPLGNMVTLEINDPGTSKNPDYTNTQTVVENPKDASQTYVEFNLNGVFDIQPGFVVKLSDGTTTKTHIITSLAVTDYDLDLDTVSGIAEAGSHVDVWACPFSGDCPTRHVTADGDGNWTADFAHVGTQADEQTTVNIVRGTWIDSRQRDEDGDCTEFGTKVPNPIVQVYPRPDKGWIQAHDWPLGNVLTLTIDNPSNGVGVDYTRTATMEQNPDNPNDIRAIFDWPDQFTPGSRYVITMTGDILGSLITKTLIVSDLRVLSADPVTDIVSGVATPGVPTVEVCLWRPVSNCLWLYPTVDGTTGEWNADYTSQDLQPDDSGWVTEYDPDSDSTWYYWGIPNPNFQVRANEERVDAYQWPVGNTVTLEINDLGTTKNPDYTDTQTVIENPKDASQTYAEFNLKGTFDVKPGFVVRLSDGTTTKTHIVTSLAFIDYDLALDTVTGVAALGSRVDIWACSSSGDCPTRHVTADGDGNWTADFAHVGTQGDEQTTLDIVKGTGIDSHQCDEDGDCTQFGLHIPNPNFNVRANEDRVEANEWPLGNTVTLEINDPGTTKNPDYTGTKIVGSKPDDSSQTYVDFNLNGIFDIQPGFVVKLSDSKTTKTHIVTSLAITDYDLDLDTVTGVAGLGSRVDVWACHSSNCSSRHVTVDGDGNWTTDFANPGIDGDEQTTFDIVRGTEGDSSQCDGDGDCTRFGWRIPNPIIDTVLVNNQMYGEEWPVGASVTVTVDDPNTLPLVDFTDTRTVVVAPKDPSRTQVTFEMGDFTLQSGQTVRMTDGHTTKIQMVSNIAVTNVNPETDVVSGTAEPNTDVIVSVWSQDGASRSVKTNQSGHWLADFSVLGSGDKEQSTFDILPGQMGEAAQYDADGDRTRYVWSVPNPRFNVRANEDQVGAHEWKLGDIVTLAINDPGTTKNPDYTDTRTIGLAPWDPSQTYAEFNLRGIFDIQPGFVVSLSDGTTTKTHIVTSLAVTDYNLDLDTVLGVAAPGSHVDLGACDSSKNCAKRHVNADGTGKWTADFAHPGSQEDEQDTVDIAPGASGDSFQTDEDGDGTLFSWSVPYPSIYVRANDDQVGANQWTLGSTVTLKIDDPGTPKNTDYTDTRIVGVNPDDTIQTYAEFNLKGIYDIRPGFLVSMSDGTTTKTLTVSNLSFTSVDINHDLVSGVAAPNVRVNVWTCDKVNYYIRHAITNGNGRWKVDFSKPGSESNEQIIFDIVNGTKIDSNQSDDDGDNTMFAAIVPLTFIIYMPLVMRGN
jgi:hypothetical protein